MSASFGRAPPIGELPVFFPADRWGCGYPPDTRQMTRTMLVVERGQCTFFEKAVQAFALNASVLVVINSEDKLESPASGLGIDPHITDKMVLRVKELSVVIFNRT